MDCDTLSGIRFAAYLAGVLDGQSGDILCRECRAFAGVLGFARDLHAELARASDVPGEWRARLDWCGDKLASLDAAPEPKAQRKLGNCALPGGGCMVKHARRFINED
jgi:hypothetical protein